MDRNETFLTAAKEFADKARRLSTITEVAIVGSVADGDANPSDIDLALIIRSLDEISAIGKYARQMSKYHNAWEVFVFDQSLYYLGRVCHRREYPGGSVDCSVEGCGTHPHLRINADFEYNEKTFFGSPIDVLWTTYETSKLYAQRNRLGITKLKKYPVLEDIQIKCILCGRIFLFSGAEQKWYKKRGLRQPKRCQSCIEKEQIEGLRDY